MAGKLDGKTALITGGNSGIGLATAKRFVAEGAFVYITARRQTELDTAVAFLGSQARAIRADVAQQSDMDAVYAQIAQEKGRLDVLFANAATASTAPIGSITEEHFDQIFDVNVKGLLFTVQKALPLMPDGSAILLNASIESVSGSPSLSVYAATKAAVRSFARTWTTDLKERRIRVNAISPGYVETPGLENLAQIATDEQRQGFYTELGAKVPLGRVAQPDDIAKAAVFLASQDADYIAGVELFVDGGAVQV